MIMTIIATIQAIVIGVVAGPPTSCRLSIIPQKAQMATKPVTIFFCLITSSKAVTVHINMRKTVQGIVGPFQPV
jgi:hypothetical protein